MKIASSLWALTLTATLPAMFAAQAAEPSVLTVFAAGTLAVPFKQIDALFESQNAGVTVQAQYGGSVKMAKRITDLHQDADLLAVADYLAIADYNVIPKYTFPAPAYALGHGGFLLKAYVLAPQARGLGLRIGGAVAATIAAEAVHLMRA